jgi:hypothetical protein
VLRTGGAFRVAQSPVAGELGPGSGGAAPGWRPGGDDAAAPPRSSASRARAPGPAGPLWSGCARRAG